MDASKILQIQKRAKSYAYRLTGSLEDAEEIAQECAIAALSQHQRNGTTHFKIKWLVLNVLERERGKYGSLRSKFHAALRHAKSIQASVDDEDEFREFVSEEHLHTGEPDEDHTSTLLDEELAERVGGLPDEDEPACVEAKRRGVTESRVSQLRAVQREKFVRAYLWEHYKEHGIEGELEIEWIEF